jgi:hypothetical protein
MTYQYDAFFSYRWHPRSDAWHRRVQEEIEYWVGLELGVDPRFFFDRKEMRPGQAVVGRLRDALLRSKCLVCFWSPRYFTSRWCLSEWKTFRMRGERVGTDLVLPASIHNADAFPASAQAVVKQDFSDFHSIQDVFWNDPRRVLQFEELGIRPFAMALAEMIRKAPPFDSFEVANVDDDEIGPEPIIPWLAND